MGVILVGGGARSGKSRWALERARVRSGARVWIATAEALDEEMGARIARHRAERGADFTTIEEPLELAGAIRGADAETVVVDCMTLWLSNVLLSEPAFAEGDAEAEVQPTTRSSSAESNVETRVRTAVAEIAKAAGASAGEVILISNEVGCGIVPENALARAFRDFSGTMNQRLAEAADEVYWMVFGQALRLK